MTSRAPGTRTVSASLALVALSLACVWKPWIPGDGPWDPQIVVDPANLAYRLVLDTTYVDELDCYARLCRQRFRVVVPEPGILTVRVIPELVSQDDQARMVLESSQGVLGRAESGRGPRSDPTVLAVRAQVDSATFFVLLESVGGKVPYQITASLAPGDGPDAAGGAVASREPPPARPVDPPPKLVEINLPGAGGGGYDPASSFSSLRTFAFPPVIPPVDRAPGQPLESPVDRQIRRLLADELERKGFRQATGREAADMLVDFSLGESTKNVPVMSLVQDWYDVSGLQWANGPATRGTLTVDILEKQSSRIAWRAWTTKGLGPGVVHGETETAYLREAVSEVLVGFPPR